MNQTIQPKRTLFKKFLQLLFRSKVPLYSALFVGILAVIWGLLPDEVMPEILIHRRIGKERKGFLLVGILYILLPSYIFFSNRRKYPSALSADRKIEDFIYWNRD